MLNREELKEIIDVGITLTTEKNKIRLIESILEKAIKLSNCDAGTLYLYRNDRLEYMVRKIVSQGIVEGGSEGVILLPPISMSEENVCSYAAIHKELINLTDISHHTQFDFLDLKRNDLLTGYHTESMLVVPMEDGMGELMGVLQLINAMDVDGKIISFSEEDEFIIRSLSSQAGVAIANMMYVEEIKFQLYSFVEAFATAVDAQTPYNALHARKVTSYVGILADYINKKHKQGLCEEYFDENRKEQLVLAAALHDIGKMTIPLSVMNKATRLDTHLAEIEKRMELLLAYYQIDLLKGRITQETYEEMCELIQEVLEFVHKVNNAGILDDGQIAYAEELATRFYEKEDGEVIPFLTDYEWECLMIRRGTLTEAERRQMEGHAEMTAKILEKVHFSRHYKNVARFAYSHHELLDGSGYPNHLKGEELELEVKILAIADIYDALIARDRPYKKPIPKEKAFEILQEMAEDGKLDKKLVDWLAEALEQQK